MSEIIPIGVPLEEHEIKVHRHDDMTLTVCLTCGIAGVAWFTDPNDGRETSKQRMDYIHKHMPKRKRELIP
jgi:hypothetical protein